MNNVQEKLNGLKTIIDSIPEIVQKFDNTNHGPSAIKVRKMLQELKIEVQNVRIYVNECAKVKVPKVKKEKVVAEVAPAA